MVAETIFWISAALLVYIYAGYPVACLGLASWRRRWPRTDADSPAASASLRVTILIAAYNEAAHIGETVANKLALDYPAELREVIVISDASDDGTDEIVAGFADRAVRLIRQEPRAGKTSALNLAVPAAGGDILVFSDANSLYAPDALRRLVAVFADPEVGYVTGRMVYRAADGSLTGSGCSAYMKYENQLRWWETGVGSVVGVDGGIDAVRRELYTEMGADQLPDFVLPLAVREQGYRIVYAPDALLYEDALTSSHDEYRMRVRVSLRAWHAIKAKAALLDPRRFGLFAWQLFSHKVLRYLAPFFQVAAFASNLALVGRSGLWNGLMLVQLAFYGLAVAGYLSRQRDLPRLLSFPYYLNLINTASAVAFWKFLRGQKQVIWNPRT